MAMSLRGGPNPEPIDIQPGVPLYMYKEDSPSLGPNPSFLRRLHFKMRSRVYRRAYPLGGFLYQVRCILGCRDVIHTLFTLFFPIPWKFRLPPPLTIQQLQQSPGLFASGPSVHIAYPSLMRVKLFLRRDTPLRSVYRLYALVVIGDQSGIVTESQYFFHSQLDWRLADIPDPKDPDPVRYALLASVIDALVSAFNWKIRIGLRRGITNNKPWLIPDFKVDPNPPFERSPEWCSHIGPLPETLNLLPGWEGTLDLKGGREDVGESDYRTQNVFSHFMKRNIMADAIQFWNV